MKSRRLSPFLGLWLGALAFGPALPATAQTAKPGASVTDTSGQVTGLARLVHVSG